MTKVLEMIITPSDSILIESPTYPGILSWLVPFGCEMVPVPIDSNGLDDAELEKVLENWDCSKPKPKLLYTVPTAGNPSGVTTITARKERILEICQKWGIIILEDDPYYLLQYDYSKLEKSYFSLDTTSKQVIRYTLLIIDLIHFQRLYQLVLD